MENNKDSALRKLMAADFAAFELQLSLDTHPDDADAMSKYTEAVKKAKIARTEFENNYGAVTAPGAAGKLPWQWISSPWSWQ